ncbi:acyl-CoA carboxylase subunit epsilon [Cellulomonas edaphi]|uniref:Acyl-CoA carboxylase subunit epsilon n=1 Tax=Cellulomonas edaphi TaxID=3053468 RepID=A0ABT7S5G8_9CELL|nr:acyl-CoA carboxylase subunit epsilon [Cellulomons edaphi]MDM7830858.1 acyl-CoA carboxylase subunit epsilon [Cellulomons edaphi]
MSDSHVQVVRGAPDDHELAALVAGLISQAVAAPEDEPLAHSAWADRRAGLRGSATWGAGADAWRWSLRG